MKNQVYGNLVPTDLRNSQPTSPCLLLTLGQEQRIGSPTLSQARNFETRRCTLLGPYPWARLTVGMSAWNFSLTNFHFLFEQTSQWTVASRSLSVVMISDLLLHAYQSLIHIKGRDTLYVIQQSSLIQKTSFKSLPSFCLSSFLHREK